MAVDAAPSRGNWPMDGVVLCCTSISPEKRTELASITVQMGAIHKLDLTSDVTHLIVGDTDTPKYKFVAKERPDVKCLLPAWVDALRASWVEALEPDLPALEAQYKLPALHNLRICVTGFEDMAYRKRLEDDVNSNGGDYRGNLTKDVTHLIAKEPSGAKYKYAIDWNIKIVSVEWLEQTLERGMILDEHLYSLSLPPAERGRNAWIRRVVSTSSLGKRSFDGDFAANGPRKLRRVASAKLNSQSVGLWTDIVSAEIQAEEPKHDQWSEQLAHNRPALQRGSSLPVKSSGPLTERSSLHAQSSATVVESAGPPLLAPFPESPRKSGIFGGKRICLYGFNEKKTAVLQKHLLSHGAEILPDHLSFTPAAMSPPSHEFLLVPHDLPADSIPKIPTHRHRPVVVTDMWVERNLHRKQYVSPETSITNVPFRRFPIAGFERLVVCSTRFEDVDLLHMSKAVKLMGATYDEEFSPKASVLICNKVVPGHEKLRHAQHWNVPTVTADWLWDCIRSGELRAFRTYLVQPHSSSPRPEAHNAQKEPIDHNKNEDKRGTRLEKVHGTDQIAQNPEHGVDREAESRPLLPGRQSADYQDPTTHDRPTKTHAQKEEEKDEEEEEPPNPIPSIPDETPPQHSTTPLQEISPNLPPPKPSPSPSPPKPPSQKPALSTTISSLLLHHHTTRSLSAKPPTTATAATTAPTTRIRRKRQLLGRAPSNTSNLSRASSVDTINTDGIGTPVEQIFSASTTTPTTTTFSTANPNPNSNSLLPPPLLPLRQTTSSKDDDDPLLLLGGTFDDDDMVEQQQQQHLQMTQLGYEDPDALAWRERVGRKVGGLVSGEGEEGDGGDEGERAKGGRRRVKEIGRVKDGMGRGLGRRTRQAGVVVGSRERGGGMN